MLLLVLLLMLLLMLLPPPHRHEQQGRNEKQRKKFSPADADAYLDTPQRRHQLQTDRSIDRPTDQQLKRNKNENHTSKRRRLCVCVRGA